MMQVLQFGCEANDFDDTFVTKLFEYDMFVQLYQHDWTAKSQAT